jgi:hypothetical protein
MEKRYTLQENGVYTSIDRLRAFSRLISECGGNMPYTDNTYHCAMLALEHLERYGAFELKNGNYLHNTIG